MRHRNLVFAAFFGLIAAFTAHSQAIDLTLGPDGSQADRGLRDGRKANSLYPQVMGRVTDFAGRSVNAAEIRFIGVEFDEVVSVRTNAFGFYQVADLAPGHSYFVSVHHRRYLFLVAPGTEVLAGNKPTVMDFLGELSR
ncbi:MAG: carboxypeptidase-like regulatory domain-containing protein [bacterium]|nr:carboxypeptidase-like regulatory domain-containing protein [bacterium]